MGLAMLWLIKANTKVFLAPSVLDMEGIFFTSNFERVGKLSHQHTNFIRNCRGQQILGQRRMKIGYARRK